MSGSGLPFDRVYLKSSRKTAIGAPCGLTLLTICGVSGEVAAIWPPDIHCYGKSVYLAIYRREDRATRQIRTCTTIGPMAGELLASAYEAAERSKPDVRVAALLRIARVQTALDCGQARRTFEQALDEIRLIQDRMPPFSWSMPASSRRP